ncbi:MAG: hypothetical protein K2Y71_21200 [Xanthobacteraceae bacterium]|nr:hypothetical protein [Xanthobacteraceae bacterium]
MGFRPSLGIGLVCALLGAAAAYADSKGPVLVIPGRPGIPVVINGYDASYTIVEGDWGLARPGQVSPVITNGPLITPAPYYSGHYYPHLGQRPGYGRREYDPPEQRGPRPAPSFYRAWGAESQQLPADVDPPANQTPIVIEPNVGWDPRRRHRPLPRPPRPPRH